MSAGRCATFRAFLADDEAQGLVEYAITLAVVALGVMVAVIFLREQLQGSFSDIGTQLRSPGSTPTPPPTPAPTTCC